MLRPQLRLGSLHMQKRTFVSSPTDVITVLTSGLEALHSTTPLTWWMIIPMATITFRTMFTLPIAIIQRRRTQRQAQLTPLVQAMGPILRLKLAQRATSAKALESQQQSPEAKMIGGQAAGLSYEQIMVLSSKERRRRQKKLYKDHNCQMWKNLILPGVQIPLWIAMSATFRDLTGWTDITSNPMDPALTTEGFLWVSDLTLSDPLAILPIVLGTLALTNVEWNAKTYSLQNTHVRRSLRITPLESILNISRFGTVFLMAIATQAPSGLALYWISSNAFSLTQNMVLDRYIPMRYQEQERWSGREAPEGSRPLASRPERE
ncbi:membrane insertase COX18 CYBJADRAFT_165209 [Cyberlindnera jadinii NRRL Y-1542]|uniref:Membrane insertase YidC/Oxa/ALB C-terminal domain-containing protein n=1 Tax=Cyberlindnera jadinii (strain ATCC 18201 / CBS 1600 / BCRC 20928 / JCM 3617 / NBRC 0987 / NRRL Y-1542) TaxID=983966 RepID=A0A1E4S8G7_CYBJN|nr:hypothetical protein CYBJADRAFT_165209 [Cyberlindnera jadinii NRRL Y-1542]ODV75806.1 hypothetical protein CYBJADRAFT_165209 [Cyberlindnera jadinii NRRL Y-1542]